MVDSKTYGIGYVGSIILISQRQQDRSYRVFTFKLYLSLFKTSKV